jgi:hypothetical protein
MTAFVGVIADGLHKLTGDLGQFLPLIYIG